MNESVGGMKFFDTYAPTFELAREIQQQPTGKGAASTASRLSTCSAAGHLFMCRACRL